ncbi:MAG: ATP-binding protein, partial [Candidatus Hodarchaeota archaeon]
NVRQTIAGYIAQRIFQARQLNQFPLPVLLVIEEAHRFAPNEKGLFSTQVLQRIAREGRKFGMGICITTQMIRNLDPVIISQCGTKIILRINNYRDLEVLAPHSDLADRSEIQLIPYLPTGTAYATGVGLSTPLVVEIRQRRTESWGALPFESS